MKIIQLFLVILISLAAPAAAGAATLGDVVINEIAWMGTTHSAADEWMELYNATDRDVNVSGWTIRSADQKMIIRLKGFILAKGFYLIERTDDNTLPEIPADLLYKGSLNNNGQHLILSDGKNVLIDEVKHLSRWPAGDNTTKHTMEKSVSGWQTSNQEGGTPKAKNSLGFVPVTSAKPTTSLPESGKSDNSIAVASLQNSATQKQSSNPWLIFFTAAALAVIFGAMTIFIKLKLYVRS